MDNRTNHSVAALRDFKNISDQRLPLLRVNLECLGDRTPDDRLDLVFIEIFWHFHAIKESAEKCDQTDIKELIHCCEVVIELLRRRKIEKSKGLYALLYEIIGAVPVIIQNRLDGIPQDPNWVKRLKGHLEEMTNPLFDFKV